GRCPIGWLRLPSLGTKISILALNQRLQSKVPPSGGGDDSTGGPTQVPVIRLKNPDQINLALSLNKKHRSCA
ncbi:MAG: hypothetical protein P8M70_13020, partial [Verrucomicrobiota bacterium]|nr:hypothetical protein [Verrucomicrobiota bacterium]